MWDWEWKIFVLRFKKTLSINLRGRNSFQKKNKRDLIPLIKLLSAGPKNILQNFFLENFINSKPGKSEKKIFK